MSDCPYLSVSREQQPVLPGAICNFKNNRNMNDEAIPDGAKNNPLDSGKPETDKKDMSQFMEDST